MCRIKQKRLVDSQSTSRNRVFWLGCRDSNPNLLIQSQLSCQLDDTPPTLRILPQRRQRAKSAGASGAMQKGGISR